jgi:hypothetical protein
LTHKGHALQAENLRGDNRRSFRINRFLMTDAQTDLETIQGFKEITVLKLDGSPLDVKVKKLNLRQLNQYGQVLGDPALMVELFCGLEPGGSDEIDPDSAQRIIDIGQDINRPIWTRFAMKHGDYLIQLDELVKEKSKKLQGLTTTSGASSSNSPSESGETPAK